MHITVHDYFDKHRLARNANLIKAGSIKCAGRDQTKAILPNDQWKFALEGSYDFPVSSSIRPGVCRAFQVSFSLSLPLSGLNTIVFFIVERARTTPSFGPIPEKKTSMNPLSCQWKSLSTQTTVPESLQLIPSWRSFMCVFRGLSINDSLIAHIKHNYRFIFTEKIDFFPYLIADLFNSRPPARAKKRELCVWPRSADFHKIFVQHVCPNNKTLLKHIWDICYMGMILSNDLIVVLKQLPLREMFSWKLFYVFFSLYLASSYFWYIFF